MLGGGGHLVSLYFKSDILSSHSVKKVRRRCNAELTFGESDVFFACHSHLSVCSSKGGGGGGSMELSWKALGKSGLGERFSLPNDQSRRTDGRGRGRKGGRKVGRKRRQPILSTDSTGEGCATCRSDKMNVISDGYRQPIYPSNRVGI